MADVKVCCDYALHVAVTSWGQRQKEDIKILTSKYGINSYKLFMAYNFMLRDSEIYQLMEVAKEVGALTMVHAENGDIIKENTRNLLARGICGPHGHELSRNEEVESEAVNRVCVISKQVGKSLKFLIFNSVKEGENSAKVLSTNITNLAENPLDQSS